MLNKDLIEQLKELPEEAIIFVEADHGQCPEKVGRVTVTTDDVEDVYYGDELDWIYPEDIQDGETITGVCIR